MRKNQLGRLHPAVAARLPRMSSAVKLGQFVKMSCTWCRTTHRYQPGDLLKVLGDVPFLNIEMNFRCSNCGKQEYMKAALELPSAQERVGMKVRRLVEIKTVQRQIWEDVTL